MRIGRGPSILLAASFGSFLQVASPATVRAAEAAGENGHGQTLPPLWLVGFFVVMLLCIAVFPLTRAHHWWENNWNRLVVAVAVSAYPAYYYIRNDFHALQETMLHEYVPFIALLGSLFLISGGIRLTGDLRATPMVNSLFLLTGTLLASFIGTTGASMLLIRALIETNRERRYKVHTIIFFIFLVSNIGGCLLPIGDPPLFLGYLAGIPFFWTLNLWKLWLPTWIFVLALYFLLDRHYLQKEPERMREWDVEAVRPLRLQGSINFLWLAGVVASVIFLNENAAVPLFRVMYMREGAMALMVALSLVTTPRGLRAANRFTLAPIGEVAALFLGIFTTVIPALTLLNVRGGELGVNTPFEFFWGTGILSSFLDNAPTYFVFFKTASGLVSSGAVEAVTLVGLGADRIPERFLTAISVGSVFLGAMTYIGNGPNFMVKAIAEESGVKMPTFLGYMKWSAIVLLPVFAIMSWWFFL